MTEELVSKGVAFNGFDIRNNQLAVQWRPVVHISDEQADFLVEFKCRSASNTSFASIQHAIDKAVEDSLDKTDKRRYLIRIGAGLYEGPIVIPSQAPPITLCGAGAANTVIVAAIDAQMTGEEYASRFKHVIRQSNAIALEHFSSIIARQKINTLNSAVLCISSCDTIINGLTIRNDYQCDRESAAPDGDIPDCSGRFARGQHQAVAVQINAADRVQIRECVLTSFQDTLYFRNRPAPISRVYIADTLIEGDVDFIFGGATAWFENCEIKSRGERGAASWATAPSTSLRQPFGFIFNGCSFTHDEYEAGECSRSFLGRQWFEAVRATPYGNPSVKGFTCTYSDVNAYHAPIGTINRQALESVGKCHVQGSDIGTHISATRPWDNWADPPWNPRYRPAQISAREFLENLDTWFTLNGLDYSWLDPDEQWLGISRM